MKRKIKTAVTSVLSLLLAVVIIIGMALLRRLALTAEAATVSGTCGDDVIWTFDEYGTLTIRGTGNMYDYIDYIEVPDDGNSAPWKSYRSNIKRVIIETGVTSIGNNAFWDCDSLTSVTIPDSVTDIGNDALYRCLSLTNIVVDTGNKNYLVSDGVLFNKNKTELLQYPTGNTNTSYVIPNGVTSIGDRAFSFCQSLTSVMIPDGVINIGDGAFSSCTNLTNVTIPDSVTSIGYGAFYYSGITSIKIPEGVTSIEQHLFHDCTGLTSTVIPDGVTSIGSWAFCGCSSLISVTIPDSVVSIGSWAFELCNSLTDIYYTGTKEEWRSIKIDNTNDTLLNATIHYAVSMSKGSGYSSGGGSSSGGSSSGGGQSGSSRPGGSSSGGNVPDSNTYVPVDAPVDADSGSISVYNYFEYTVYNYEIIICGYTGTDTDVSIPSEIDGMPVTGIAENAFAGSCAQRIEVPSSVYQFGTNAFGTENGENRIIVGEKDSPAERYAADNGMVFEYSYDNDNIKLDIKTIIIIAIAASAVLAIIVVIVVYSVRKKKIEMQVR